MKNFCPRFEHLSRRALMKGSLATAGGASVMNWGGLVHSKEATQTAQKKKKHVILLWLNGGCSQFETFDMKVGRPTGGLFREISTNVAGSRVCELMPNIAQRMDQIAVIRSMKTSQVSHPGGIYLMHTGYASAANVRFPEIGAIVAKYCGAAESDLPNFVKISSNGSAGSGFLGPQYGPFALGRDGDLPTFSTSRLDEKIEARRNDLRSFVEAKYAEDRKADVVRMHREGYDRARRLQNVRHVFDNDAEWEKARDKYGDTKVGRRCLIARCLIESGVSFVEVGQSGYDTHADNFVGHKAKVPVMDQAWSALIDDLQERGLYDDTLIIWMGEIGRTPRINNRSGRDHYVRNWSAALAGGGIKQGLVYGESDADGLDVKDNPVTEGDFFATIYKSLGLDPTTENMTGVRPIPLAPFGHKVVDDLLI